MGDVLYYIIDGTSGLAPGAVDGKALAVGICSKGEVGKGYNLGKDSDLVGLLGYGPLTDFLNDYFSAAGQKATIVAVPVEGKAYATTSPVKRLGVGPDATISGLPNDNADVVAKVTLAGLPGVAKCLLSLDGGGTFDETELAIPASGILNLDLGCQLNFASQKFELNTTYAFAARLPIGPITQKGVGPAVTAQGEPRAAASVVLQIVKDGPINEGQYRLSLDGGESWTINKTLPIEGKIKVDSIGVDIILPADESMVSGNEFHFEVYAPVPSISGIMSALETPLGLFDTEGVHVVGPTDASDWAALGVLADERFSSYKPTIMYAEARMPHDGEDMDDWVNWLIAERAKMAHRFVLACTAFGPVSDSSGQTRTRNWSGKLAARVVANPVQRHIGRIKSGAINGVALLDNYKQAHQKALETAGFITAKRYEGMSGIYWGDDRTLADPTSDYFYLRPVRTIFKGMRLARIAALNGLYDEYGDPRSEEGATGLAYLLEVIQNAVDTMVKAVPKELAALVITAPEGQDIVNNGLALKLGFVGIPVIGDIVLYSYFTWAGSSFDARIKEADDVN